MLTIGEEAVLKRVQIPIGRRCGKCHGVGHIIGEIYELRNRIEVSCWFCAGTGEVEPTENQALCTR